MIVTDWTTLSSSRIADVLPFLTLPSVKIYMFYRQMPHKLDPAILEKWSHYWASELIPCIFGVSKNKIKRRGGGGTEQQQTYQFTQGYNILHRLQVHHLTLTFIIHNKYISTLYLASERSERDTLRSVQSRIAIYTRKMVPITGRASS